MLRGMKILSKKNKHVISFTCEEDRLSYFPKPVPASKVLPEWYKDMPSFTGNKQVLSESGANGTIKKCMPVFDMATTGYMILLPCDVIVGKNPDGTAHFAWSIQHKMITDHPMEQIETFKISNEFLKQPLKWTNPWIITTPKGWSTMFVQPTHRDDLPFQILPAIVDTDEFSISVQFPFFIKKDFEGVIPANTPIAQIIPFKRENWESKFEVLPDGERIKRLEKHSIYLHNRYKRTSWKKKSYK